MDARAPKSLWKTLGGSTGSILDVYGGEYEFDRYNIMLHNRRGADRGVSIRYGKNLATLEQDRNCADVYTGVYPFWAASEGDAYMELPEQVLHAPGEYDHTSIMPLDCSTEFQEAPTEDQLREYAQKYMESHNIGVPDVSWTVEFVQLEQTEEYKGQAWLERVLLGDTVNVIFPQMRVDAAARAVKTAYDCLAERYKSITLGKVKSNLADTIVRQEQEIEKKPDKTVVDSIISALGDAITGATGGSIRVLDTDGDGKPDELYIADDPDPNLAVRVWRFNYLGWAASTNGYNGPFKMGATLADGLLSEFVTAAHLTAGTIQSQDAETFFCDLDNGILRIKKVEELSETLIAMQAVQDGLKIAVQKIESDGVTSITTTTGYTFGADGLHIAKDGHEISNLLDHTGMYVSRGNTVVFRANEDGCEGENMTVRNYLVVAKHSRKEGFIDEKGRTAVACFWI